jgi:hypothetical protein
MKTSRHNRLRTVFAAPRAMVAFLLPLALAAGNPDRGFAQKSAFVVYDSWIMEGNQGIQHAEVEVTLSKPQNKTVSVNYSTADGTATAGSDYDAVSGTLTFQRGETSKSILIPVLGDRIAEPDEYFVVELSHPSKGTTIARKTGYVTIWDDEPRLGVNDVTEYEGDSGTTPFTFLATLSHAYDEVVTVDFATHDGTAVAGIDYVATSGSLTFAAGETTKTITVEVIGNIEPEPNKDFLVILSGASSNAHIDRAGKGTIYDDDGYYDDDYDIGWGWDWWWMDSWWYY